MKQLAKYLLPLCCGIALASCYGLDKEEYRELAPITVSGLDRTIYAKATETLHLDKLRVESESGQDLVYEWSYGKPAGDFPGMVDTTFISSSPTLDYAFDKAGSYVLRLRIDNGESIGFHYYDLRVQAGFDEGFLILCNDDEGAGSLAFVKKRSPQEEAEGAQEIWDNLLTINPEYDFRSLRDVYVFSSPGYASGILISSGDDEGSIYRLDPVTLSVTYRMKGMDEYGVRTGEILGERTSGTAHWAYLIGDDERAYRYEFSTDMLIVRETPFPARYGRQGLFASKTAGVRDILMFSEAGITGFPNSRIAGYAAPDGYEFINMAAGRIGAGQYDASKYYCIARTIEGAPKTVKIISTSSSLSSPTEIKTYDEVQPMLMNANTRIVTTKLNGNAYYDYDNKIYHWAMTGVDPVVPAEGAKPDITLPDGEQIMDICTNAVDLFRGGRRRPAADRHLQPDGDRPQARQPLRLQSEDDGEGEGVCRHLRKTRGRGLQVPHIELTIRPARHVPHPAFPSREGRIVFREPPGRHSPGFALQKRKNRLSLYAGPTRQPCGGSRTGHPRGQSHPFSRGGGGGRGIICAET